MGSDIGQADCKSTRACEGLHRGIVGSKSELGEFVGNRLTERFAQAREGLGGQLLGGNLNE